MEKSKKKKYFVIAMLFTVIVMIGSSYAWWTSTAEQTGINQITSTCLKVSLNEEKDAIHLEKAYPITDEEAKDLTPFTFKVENTCDTSINYTVNLGITNNTTLDSQYIAVQLNSNTKRILNSLKETTLEKYKKGYELATGILNGKESKEYSLKLWMDEHVTVEDEDSMNKTFESKVVVNATLNTLAKVYTDDTLNGADPVLKDNLIPVKIDKDNGTVTKANIEEEWYDYKNKEWANAVILKDDGIIEEDGTIKEENIESYFVWIPKYKYKIFDMGNYETLEAVVEDKGATTPIEIEFGIYNTVDNTIECITPASGEDGKCAVDKWMTPSAFTSFNTNGLWVGKFETSNAAGNKVQIKPNVNSWTNITIGNAFDASYNYKRNLDSHMMKNTEWGAVAYLTQSIYGRCTSNTECTQVALNGNTSYMTGYSSTNIPYTTNISVASSTTNNYTGIYDMSGGVWEYTTSLMYKSDNQNIEFGSSGFSSTDDLHNKKYYDIYNYVTSSTDFSKRILGDATGELGPFSNNGLVRNSYFGSIVNNANFTYSWFTRGGRAGLSNSFFSFSRDPGSANGVLGFRIILAPL